MSLSAHCSYNFLTLTKDGGEAPSQTADPNVIQMKTTNLKAYARENIGKATNKSLRREGKVPGVIYDNSAVTHVSFDIKELKAALYTPETYILNLEVEGGDNVQAIIRETQFHPVTEHPLHIDLLRVTDEKSVILELPVLLVGTPSGVAKGGKLVTKLRKIKVKGVPSQLPDSITINVAKLDLGSTIKVADADIPDLEIITSPTTGIASVEIPRAVRSASAEGAEGAEGEGEGEETADTEE
jgi:large subunit ribosomal protein L25